MGHGFVAIVVQEIDIPVLGVTIARRRGVRAGRYPARALPSPRVRRPRGRRCGVALPARCGGGADASRWWTGGCSRAALAFLLSAPAINPIVLVATAVAFPGRPEVVAARFLASLLSAMVVGLVWARTGRDELLRITRRRKVDEGPPLSVMMATAQHDLLNAGGFLIIGAATAATLQTVVPRSALDSLGGSSALAFVAMAGLAVIMAIWSEADALVAASFTAVPMTARLVFMVVGPMVDVKLIARRRARRRSVARGRPAKLLSRWRERGRMVFALRRGRTYPATRNGAAAPTLPYLRRYVRRRAHCSRRRCALVLLGG